MDTVRVVNHDAFDDATLTHLGRTSYGGEIWVNSEYLQADVRIVTGFIEPHFFAGFSGGPKGIVPGAGGHQTIMHLHNARMIGDPRSTWGRLEGNPVQGEIREAVALAPPHFMVNVALNARRQITAVWAGHYITRTRGGLPRRGRARDAGRRREPVRHRGHHQQRLSARPEPLPGGQGHERRRAHRPARRGHHGGRRVQRRRARARQFQAAAARCAATPTRCWT